MRRELFVRRVRIDAPAKEVFRWHARPNALKRLTPPWEYLDEDLAQGSSGIEVGASAVVRVRIGPFDRVWVSEHRIHDEGQFSKRSPFELDSGIRENGAQAKREV